MTAGTTDTDSTLRVAVSDGHIVAEVHGNGAPLLLLHGWSLDRRSFLPQVNGLADEFRVITYDRRGFGASSAPPSLEHELDDIDRLLDACGERDVHLLGVSQGGRIALRYAVARSARIRSLILQGAMVDGLDVEDAGADRIPIDVYTALARQQRLAELREAWLRHPMMSLRNASESSRELLATIVSDYAARDLVSAQPESSARDSSVLEGLDSFPRPILLLTGAGETEARKTHAKTVLARAKQAREQMFDASGHLPNIEEPERFNEVLAEFCRAAEGTRPSD